MSASPRIFFDLDGPILDVAERHHRVYADSVRDLGGMPVARETFWAMKRERTPEAVILRQSGLDDASGPAFQDLKLRRIESADYLGLDVLQPGVPFVLERLRESHRLILVTLRTSRALLDRQLATLELASLFSLVLSGRESEREGWRIKSDLIRDAFPSCAPADWIVGDTETDVLAGQHLGIRTVAVCNGIRSEALLRALAPSRVLSSTADLLEAICV